MKRNLTRFLSSIIAMSLFLGLSAPAFASDAAVLAISGGSGKAGDEISSAISISGNPGFTAYNLTVTYDHQKLSPIDSASELAGTFNSDLSYDVGEMTFEFTADDSETGIVDDGELLTIDFIVNPNAQAGDSQVSISGSATAVDGSDIPLSFDNGVITVEESVQVTTYDVTVGHSGSGSASADKRSYAAGETVTITATPLTGYEFSGWTTESDITFEDASSAKTTFVMPARKVMVSAVFTKEKASAKITLSQATGGKITASVDEAVEGDEVSVTAIPDEGYFFSKWIISGGYENLYADDVPKTYFDVVASDITVSAKFEKVPEDRYAVTLLADKGGHPYSTKAYYSSGEIVSLGSNQDEMYNFESWSCDDRSVSISDPTEENITFRMPPRNVVVYASYSYDPVTRYRVTISTEGGGIANTSNDVYTYKAGETVNIAATAASGYTFYGWSPLVSGVSFMNPGYAITSFEMPARDVTIQAMFILSYYAGAGVTGSAGSSGSGAGGGAGSTTASPEGTYTVTFNTSGGSSVASQTVAAGGTATRPADPVLSGHTFAGWYADPGYSYEFNFSQVINSSTTLYAKWKSTEASSTTTNGTVSFTDVKTSDWFATYVNSLAAKGIVSGMGSNKFAPQDKVTRAQFVKILAGIAGASAATASSEFSDVKPADWFAGYVTWAKNSGVAGGSNGKFNPNAPISRQDMAVMIKRFADYMKTALPTTTAASDFADAASISGYAKDAVKAMQTAGIIGGKTGNRFDPLANATRAEACKMIYVLMQILGK